MPPKSRLQLNAEMLRANSRIDQRHQWDSVWCVPESSPPQHPLYWCQRFGRRAQEQPPRALPGVQAELPPSPHLPCATCRWQWILNARGILYYSRPVPDVPGYVETVYLLGERHCLRPPAFACLGVPTS